MKTSSVTSAAILAVAALVATGCKPSSSSSHDHASHEGHDHGHAHSAKMGGQLVELGDHAFNVELLSDREKGTLTLWTLDAHAEHYVRLTNDAVTVVFRVGGQDQTLALKAAANPATGERVGATAQFEGQADWLKTTNILEGQLPELVLGGKAFTNVTFQLTK